MKAVANIQAEMYLHSRMSLSGVSITMLRNFPYATLTLKNIKFDGIGQFEGYTFIEARRLRLVLSYRALFVGQGFDIVKLIVEDADINTTIFEDGSMSWDILNSRAKEETSRPDDPRNPKDFRLRLRQIHFNNVDYHFADLRNDVSFSAPSLNLDINRILGRHSNAFSIKAASDKITLGMREGFSEINDFYCTGAVYLLSCGHLGLKEFNVAGSGFMLEFSGSTGIESDHFFIDIAIKNCKGDVEKAFFNLVSDSLNVSFEKNISDLHFRSELPLRSE